MTQSKKRFLFQLLLFDSFLIKFIIVIYFEYVHFFHAQLGLFLIFF